MRSRSPLPRTRLCGTASMEPIMQGWFDTIRPQCERVRSVLCARWLSPEPTDHVRYRTCADGTVRPPQPSTGPGAWTLLTGALRRVSGVVSSQCVCGPTSKVAQARPREAPRVPAPYTLCMRTCREAVHGQGKRRRHKVAYGLQKVDRLGVLSECSAAGAAADTGQDARPARAIARRSSP